MRRREIRPDARTPMIQQKRYGYMYSKYRCAMPGKKVKVKNEEKEEEDVKWV
jgi:hypothetical protein